MQYKTINIKNELIELFDSSKDIIDSHFYNDGLYKSDFIMFICDIVDKELVNTKNFDYFIEKILDNYKKFFPTNYDTFIYRNSVKIFMKKLIKMIDEINNKNLINILFNYQLELDKRKVKYNAI